MGIKSKIGHEVDKLATAVSALVGVGVGIQVPQFFAQYGQRIGGAADYAAMISRREAANPQFWYDAQNLKRGLYEIVNSVGIDKLRAFLEHANWDIAQATLHDFTPGLAVDSDLFGYALGGAIAGYLGYQTIRHLPSMMIGTAKILGAVSGKGKLGNGHRGQLPRPSLEDELTSLRPSGRGLARR